VIEPLIIETKHNGAFWTLRCGDRVAEDLGGDEALYVVANYLLSRGELHGWMRPAADQPDKVDAVAAPKQPHSVGDWKWFGSAGHFICGQWCRFHLCTQVGPFLVSTVGQYVHPRHGGGSELGERQFLEKHPNGEEIGAGRTYETMVFVAGTPCAWHDCDCGLPAPTGNELDFRGYTNARDATRGHHEICKKWSHVSIEEVRSADSATA
jgi:hypothetical protein